MRNLIVCLLLLLTTALVPSIALSQTLNIDNSQKIEVVKIIKAQDILIDIIVDLRTRIKDNNAIIKVKEKEANKYDEEIKLLHDNNKTLYEKLELAEQQYQDFKTERKKAERKLKTKLVLWKVATGVVVILMIIV